MGGEGGGAAIMHSNQSAVLSASGYDHMGPSELG